MRHPTLHFLLCALFGLGFGCVPDKALKTSLEIEPVARDDGWRIGDPAEQGFDADALHAAYAPVFSEDALPTVISMLVVRHGVLVAEGYARDRDDIDTLENIKSATKSFTSVLLGIAIDRGYLDPDLDRPIAEYLPEAFEDHARYAKITLRDALTMQTGLDFDNDSDTNVLRGDRHPDSLDFVLDQPQAAAPGEQFLYNDGNPHLIGAVIAAVTGMSIAEFAERNLFEPLGITRYHWDHHVDGLQYGAFGLYLTPRDLARFGQMVLDGGTWRGRRIVSQAWLDAAMAVQVEQPDGWHYGYYFWVNPELGWVAARGHGGQRANTVPAHDLLVVLTAEPTGSGDKGVQQPEFEALVDDVIAAIRAP